MQSARSRIAHNYTAAADHGIAVKDINENMDYHSHANHYEYWNTATTNKDTFIDIYGFPYAFPLTNANCDGTGDTTKHGNSGGETDYFTEQRRDVRDVAEMDTSGR